MVRKIEIGEVGKLYRQHIKKDFPPAERPPCFVLKSNLRKGVKEGFIYAQNGVDLAYALVSTSEEMILITLFAVYKGQRGSGIGSKFLKELLEYYKDRRAVIVEVEKPEQAKEDKEKIICEKRITFYERIQFKMYKDIDYVIFGIPMYIMVYSNFSDITKEEVIFQVKKLYRGTLRKRYANIMDKFVKIK